MKTSIFLGIILVILSFLFYGYNGFKKHVPLLFTKGELLTHPEPGCLESSNGKYYFTDTNGIRRSLNE